MAVVMADKRDECGCHRGCSVLSHDCPNPCRWPNCLTEAEHEQLLREVDDMLLDRHRRDNHGRAGL